MLFKSKRKAEAKVREYTSYLAIARGAQTEDLKNAVEDYHRAHGGIVHDFRSAFNFGRGSPGDAPYIKAFQEVLDERMKQD